MKDDRAEDDQPHYAGHKTEKTTSIKIRWGYLATCYAIEEYVIAYGSFC